VRDGPDFQALFEQSPDVLLVLLPDSPRFTMVAGTRKRFEATHTDPGQTLGMGLFELFPDNPDDPAATGMVNLRASLERVLATRAPDTMAVQKYDIRGPDGEFVARYWSPRNLPVFAADGTIQYILHRVEDVTELVRISEAGEGLQREVVNRSRELDAAVRQLREANQKLSQLDAAKTAFFSNISHEFRTPLTLMLGPLADGLADRSAALDGTQRLRMQTAYDNSLRLLKLVNALLDFARIEAGRQTANYAPEDFAALVRELAGMFQSAIETAGLRLVIDCPPLSGPLWIDRDMWEKIIPNLMSNALKYTMQGEIAVRLRETAEHAVLEVSDTGVGIPEPELPRIFERFHRVAGVTGRTHEGTGIGLALVRELVTLHGGRIEVRSTEGEGTTFTVAVPHGHAHLPAESVAEVAATPRPTGRDAQAHAVEAARWVGAAGVTHVEAGTGDAAAGTGAQVLVVDDNADLRRYVANLLAPLYQVRTAVDGVAALAAIREAAPEIVLSDVMMPRLNGVELLQALRADPATAAIPVILLSARAGEESTVEGLDAGADDYLTKPFAAQELLARVRAHLQLARARREWTAELERANRELDAFSYSVAHDLRAPLRAIEGFSQILAEEHKAQLDGEGLRLLDMVRGSTQRMAQLIDGLLHLARVTRSELHRVSTDLSALARTALAQLAADGSGRRVEIAVTDGLHADVDPRLLQAVLANLLGNAWKFSSRQPHARIEFGSCERDGERAYFVRDNGAGFDMDYASRLFGAFQRLHPESEFPGTGIGLATVARIIGRHGGRIWAEGAVGQGATFFFTLDDGRPAPQD
jgi:signal transduction histidine kinase